jgi:hypothetical protein
MNSEIISCESVRLGKLSRDLLFKGLLSEGLFLGDLLRDLLSSGSQAAIDLSCFEQVRTTNPFKTTQVDHKWVTYPTWMGKLPTFCFTRLLNLQPICIRSRGIKT